MKARILIIAGTQRRARELAENLDFVHLPVDTASWRRRPTDTQNHRLLIWEPSARMKHPDTVLESLTERCHVALLLPELDAASAAQQMQNPRIHHLIGRPNTRDSLYAVVDKLLSGAIFGLERYLPAQANIQYRRVRSFKERSDLVDEVASYLQERRVRGQVRRAALHIVLELLMNAMYQAPVDKDGVRVFKDVEPKVRIRRRTPRPVSLRYATVKGAVFLCVRDRYGTFRRDDLARYLLRCTTEEAPIEDKKLGAGLGLYQVVSMASRVVINILPGSVCEFICVIEPPSAEASPLRLLSVTTGSLANPLAE